MTRPVGMGEPKMVKGVNLRLANEGVWDIDKGVILVIVNGCLLALSFLAVSK